MLIILISLTTGTVIYTYDILSIDERKGILINFYTPFGVTVDWKKVKVQVTAILGSNGSLITLFTGFLNKSELFLDANDLIVKEMFESWIPMHREHFTTCLMLDVWIFLENGTILETRPPISIPIQPVKALREVIKRDVLVNPQIMIKQRLLRGECCDFRFNGKVEPTVGPIYECGYEWWIINDHTYYSSLTDIPILIITNPCSYSGVVGWTVTMTATYETTFRMTFSYGTNIIAQAPNVNLVTYSVGWSISEKYTFIRSDNTLPQKSQWVYIRGKFAHVHEKKYWVCRVAGQIVKSEPTDDERIKEYIYSLQLDGNHIVGGYKDGLPSQNIMDWFYDGTEEEHLYIQGTSLSDGDLNVGEIIYFEDIINCYDQYNEDFEIGIPVGALVAALAGFSAPYSTLLSPLMISMGWGQSYTIDLNGILENKGRYLGHGYNIFEAIYIRVSKYRYTSESGYTFKVPAGIYFKCY